MKAAPGRQWVAAVRVTLRGRLEPRPLVAALVERRSGGRDAFSRILRTSLYEHVPGIQVDPDSGAFRLNLEAFVAGADENRTLRAIGELCAHRTHGRYVPNHRVRSILTLNLDALLQVYVKHKFGRRLLRAYTARAPRAVSGK